MQSRLLKSFMLFCAIILLVGFAFYLFQAAAIPVQAQTQEPGSSSRPAPYVSAAVKPVLSPAFRDLPILQPRQAGVSAPQVNPRQITRPSSITSPRVIDPVLQSASTSPLAVTSVLTSFEGVSLAAGGTGIPPDTTGAVGPANYVQMVNGAMSIFDKNGNKLAGPTAPGTLWQGQNNACENNGSGDPIVRYDRPANRWLVSQFAFANKDTPPWFECIAISQTANPQGAYYTYSYDISDKFPDYPKIGVWPDAYYMGTNETPYAAYAFDRNAMLAGTAGVYQKFTQTENLALPSDVDGAIAPPAGAPNYFYTFNSTNQVKMWAFHVDFATPANSTFTPLPDVAMAAYNKTTGDLIPQQGETQMLDSIAEWPMYRLAYRNFGTYESLVGNFSVDADAGKIGIRWFELRKTGAGNWDVYQQGTYSPDTAFRWIGSIAQDNKGNIALGYSVSATDLFPSIRFTTRLASDPLGTMQAETTIIAGSASQSAANGGNRWGDYSTMDVDPVDDCTFWYTNEYLVTDTAGWQTRVAAFRLPDCGATIPPPNTTPTYMPLVARP
jgi:hypothetical protein